jgi:hypothetical protein
MLNVLLLIRISGLVAGVCVAGGHFGKMIESEESQLNVF